MSHFATILRVALGVFLSSAAHAQGSLASCPNPIPDTVRTALKQAVEYRKNCPLFNGRDNFKIVINDYSASGKPTMYIYDSTGTTCEKSTPVAYGGGPGKANREKPVPCSESNEHLTPPGFHITEPHDGAKYNNSDSLTLVGLEDQGSAGRSILIHPTASQPGTGCTWGCSGISPGSAVEARDIIGEGSLVYNYFGDTPLANGCNTKAGFGDQHNASSCKKDPGGGGGSSGPGGSSKAPGATS